MKPVKNTFSNQCANVNGYIRGSVKSSFNYPKSFQALPTNQKSTQLFSNTPKSITSTWRHRYTLLSNLTWSRARTILVPCWHKNSLISCTVTWNRLTWLNTFLTLVNLRISAFHTSVFYNRVGLGKHFWQTKLFYWSTKRNFYLTVGWRWQVVRGILIQFTLTVMQNASNAFAYTACKKI